MEATINFNTTFFAGFTLAGYRLPNGTIQSVTGAKMNGWPDKIKIEGITFTFEYEEIVGKDGLINAQYV